MTSLLNPYITFGGDARQAMEFYRDVFGGDLRINTFGEYGQEGEGADGVMHAMLQADTGFTLMASDTAPGMSLTQGDNISISLSGEDAEEMRGYWKQLSDAGTVVMPLEKQMWGDEFGMCRDQFGINWMVNINQQES